MANLWNKVNNYKTYIVCAVTIVYTWLDVILSYLVQNNVLAISSAQITPISPEQAILITFAALGAAAGRQAIQKSTDAAKAAAIQPINGAA